MDKAAELRVREIIQAIDNERDSKGEWNIPCPHRFGV